MGRPWIRLYTEVPNDPKVQRLPAALFKFWINCLCLAGANDGILPHDPDVAWCLKMSDAQAASNLEALFRAGLLEMHEDLQRYTPHGWGERQYESDISAPRVRAFRERQKKQERNVTDGVTCNAPLCSVSVSVSGSEDLKKKKDAKSEIDPREGWFEEFWAGYWRKTAKAAGHKAYFSAIKSDSMREIVLAAVKFQHAGMMDREPEHRPHASTWLNQKRWDDEPELPSNGHPKKSRVDALFDEIERDRLAGNA